MAPILRNPQRAGRKGVPCPVASVAMSARFASEEGQSSVLDDLDLAVIAALQDDSRRSFTSVAEELGVAEGTVRSRVNRMKRLDILDFGLDIDPQVLDRVCVYVCVWVRGPLMSRTIQKI